MQIEARAINLIHINSKQLDTILPNVYGTSSLEPYISPLNVVMQKFEINTKVRAAAFIAQVGHESGEFQTRIENLNYSANGLKGTFPKYFKTLASAEPYARQPAKIANYVYANRMGNGSIASGDGWKFKGRGLIQLTGRENVTAFANYKKLTIDQTIEYLETVSGAVESAGWFWAKRNLNSIADTNSVLAVTKLVNGGTSGLEHRTILYNNALKTL